MALYSTSRLLTVRALGRLVAAREADKAAAVYQNEMLWCIATILCRDKSAGLPRYTDIMERATRPKDDRTGAEIVEDLRAKLERRRARRGG